MNHRLVLALATVATATVAQASPALADHHGHRPGPPALQAVAGTVAAVGDGTLQLQIQAVGRPGPRPAAALTAGATLAVSVTPQTRLYVTDVDGDGSVTLADVTIGDQVIVSTVDANATPIVAASVLDRTHQPPAPGDDDNGNGSTTTPGSPTPPAGGAPATPPVVTTPAPARGHGSQRQALRRLRHRTLRVHAHAGGFADGVLSVTLSRVDRMGRHAPSVAGMAARVLVGDRTVVVSGGVVLTGAARTAALAGAGDVLVIGRLTAPSTWPADATGAAVPTLRARRIVVPDPTPSTTTDPTTTDPGPDPTPADPTPTDPPTAVN